MRMSLAIAPPWFSKLLPTEGLMVSGAEKVVSNIAVAFLVLVLLSQIFLDLLLYTHQLLVGF
ncbi:MAG: hypothetical protein F6K31_39565 [Symploca sp. SIO2G7]|nr:hypothetical protein [Symploca sp. SIO2G7]